LAWFATIAVVSVCAWLARFPLGDLRYTTGLRGTPGTYTASACGYEFQHKGAPRCTGDFVPRIGGPVDRAVTFYDTFGVITVGQPAPFERTPKGTHLPVGFVPAVFDVIGALSMVLLATAAMTGLSVMRIFMLTNPSRPLLRRAARSTFVRAASAGLVLAAVYAVFAA
jgi:hypothetical protein